MTNFTVADMTCGHCKSAIETAIAAAGGRAEIDLQDKRVSVEGLAPDAALRAIREAGYSPVAA